MSGTSLDAIDAVVVSFDAAGAQLIASYEYAYPDNLRRQVLGVCTGQSTTLQEIGTIDHKLGKLFATVVVELLNHALLGCEEITAIGCHGQTVFHKPSGDSPFSMQLGDANLIAAMTGINTIADFRRFDMALGGQGAPLVPAFHRYLFEARDSTTVVLNIGGIANISVIHPDGEVIGFDTGPGHVLLDSWCERHTGHRYDQGAQWGAQGEVNRVLLNQLLSDPYLDMHPPKSTGREHYNLGWLEQQLAQLPELQTEDSINAISVQDIQRTLCEFTAVSVALHVREYKGGKNCELLVCGGGADNPLLMELLQHHLQDWRVLPTSNRGIPADFMEAMAFAWLARQRWHDKPSSLPSVTGAACEASLGVIYPVVGTVPKVVL